MLGNYKLNEIYNKDSLEFLKTFDDFTFDINYSDPPYQLGSEVIIRKDGKVDYKKSVDFMNKWGGLSGEYWEQWFKEAYRTLKHGGYCIMFGMDRQLLLFKYYANLAGFEEQQSLYWYFISNFPKATDLSKQIDKNNGKHNYLLQFTKWFDEYCTKHKLTNKQIDDYLELSSGGSTSSHYRGWNTQQPRFPRLNLYYKLKDWLDFGDEWDEIIKEAEREVISTKKGLKSNNGVFNNENSGLFDKDIDITAPSTDLAKKYDGYKYSISPLKQTNETILIFRKPYKSGSCLHDTLAFENGDNECRSSCLNIDGNRVGTESRLNAFAGNKGTGFTPSDDRDEKGKGMFSGNVDGETETTGRYPSQTFCNEKTAEVLDKQSGISKGGTPKLNSEINRVGLKEDAPAFNSNNSGIDVNKGQGMGNYGDTGGCSKILHKCNFEKEDYDIYNYQPKVSKSERNAGCDDMEDKDMGHNTGMRCNLCGKWTVGTGACECDKELRQEVHNTQKNNHPTLKPIALNEKILKLFKTPNNDKIVYPFAGSGSEVIGGLKAGFTNWVGCEINPDYVEIAKARIDYWTTQDKQVSIFDLERE